MMDRGELGDSLVPQYRFEWEDDTERTTSEIHETAKGKGELNEIEIIETLSEIGEEDEDCEVTLLGYET